MKITLMRTHEWWMKTFELRGRMMPSALVAELLAQYGQMEEELRVARQRLAVLGEEGKE